MARNRGLDFGDDVIETLAELSIPPARGDLALETVLKRLAVPTLDVWPEAFGIITRIRESGVWARLRVPGAVLALVGVQKEEMPETLCRRLVADACATTYDPDDAEIAFAAIDQFLEEYAHLGGWFEVRTSPNVAHLDR